MRQPGGKDAKERGDGSRHVAQEYTPHALARQDTRGAAAPR